MLERTYVVVLVALVVGAPLLMAFARSVGRVEPDALIALVPPAVGLLVVFAALVPIAIGPVRASESEIWFFIDGPIGPGPVLLPRAAIAVFVSASLLLTVGVVAFAVHRGDVAVGALLGGCLGIVLVAIAVIAATADVFAIRASIGLGGAVAASSVAVVVAHVGVLPGAIASVVLTTAVAGLAAARIRRTPLRALLSGVDQRSRSSAAMMAGDVGGLVPPLPTHRYRARARRTVFRPGVVARTVDRDLLGLRRIPWIAAFGLLAVVASGASAALSCSAPVLLGAALVLGQTGCLPLTVGLRDRADQVGADVLEPGSFLRRFVPHLVVPFVAVAVALTIGGGIGVAIGLVTDLPLSGVACVPLVGVAMLGVRVWLAGAGTVPLGVLAPVASPIGELSGLVFVGWVLRGILPAGLALFLAAPAGTAAAAAVVAAIAVLLAVGNGRSLRRQASR